MSAIASDDARCVDCQSVLHGPYCAQCGLRRPVRPVTVHSLWHDLVHGLLHADRGALHTCKALLRHPGTTVRAYLAGRTGRLTPPLQYLLLCLVAALAAGWLAAQVPAVSSAHVGFPTGGGGGQAGYTFRVGQGLGDFSRGAGIILLLCLSGFSWLVFRRDRRPYPDHLVVAAYAFAQALLVGVTAFVITLVLIRRGLVLPRDAVDIGLLSATAWYTLSIASFFEGGPIRRMGGALVVVLASLVAYFAVLLGLVAAGVAMGMLR